MSNKLELGNIAFDLPKNQSNVIKVIGVGGGGSNAINHMFQQGIKGVDFVNISDADLDNDMYESAEKQYLQNNHNKSISSFKKYLQNFPRGLHALQANFYLAQSLFSEKKHQETEKISGTITSKLLCALPRASSAGPTVFF